MNSAKSLAPALGLWLGTLGLSVWSTTGRAASPVAGERLELVVLNAQFLPGVAGFANRRSNPAYRANAIVQRLADYDVVALCEIFDPPARQAILEGFRARHGEEVHFAVPRAEDRSGFGIDSGLVVISRRPLEAHWMCYRNDSSPAKYGLKADGFSSKGAVHVRVGGPPPSAPHQFDLILTHLESKDAPARREQYALLADFAAQYRSPERPLLICGDLNTRGDPRDREDPQSEYQAMMACLQKACPGMTDLIPEPPAGTNQPEDPSGGRRIDYILLANPATGPSLLPIHIRVDHLADTKVGTLSDHAAVCGEFEWNGPSTVATEPTTR